MKERRSAALLQGLSTFSMPFCAGAALARMEAQIAIPAFFAA